MMLRGGAAASSARWKHSRQFIPSTCHIWHGGWQPTLQGCVHSRTVDMCEAGSSHSNKEGRESGPCWWESIRPPYCCHCLLLTSAHPAHFLGFGIWLLVFPTPMPAVTLRMCRSMLSCRAINDIRVTGTFCSLGCFCICLGCIFL